MERARKPIRIEWVFENFRCEISEESAESSISCLARRIRPARLFPLGMEYPGLIDTLIRVRAKEIALSLN